jgi:hypothetical protein
LTNYKLGINLVKNEDTEKPAADKTIQSQKIEAPAEKKKVIKSPATDLIDFTTDHKF